MSKRHKSVIQFIEGVKSRKDRMRSPDGSNKAWQDLMYKGYQNKSSSIQANTAFMDIAEDLYETNHELALKVYQTLYKSGSIPNVGSIQKEGFWKIGGRGNQLHDVIDNGFPSGYEGGNNERNAHMQLLAVLQKNIAKFGGQDIEEIAEAIYGFAEVFDEGGGVPNIVLTKKELKENNIRGEDVQESMRYLIIAPRKNLFTNLPVFGPRSVAALASAHFCKNGLTCWGIDLEFIILSACAFILACSLAL